MKKVISLITMLAIMIQITGLTAFAGTVTTDKSNFTNISEVYGAYTYDIGGFNREVVVFTATDYAYFFRTMCSTKLVKGDTIITSSPKYTLSKDKKKVTASYTVRLSHFDIKMNSVTVFMKDKNGKVYFNDEYADDVTYSNFKSYQSLEACRKDIVSSKFLPILEAENDMQKQINQFDEQIAAQRKNYKDTEPLSETNQLDGYYKSEDGTMAMSYDFQYDYDYKTYDDFVKLNLIDLYFGDEKYELNTPYYLIEDGTVSYMQNDHNFLELTATDRHHITKIKFVYNDEVIYEGPVNLTYSE